MKRKTIYILISILVLVAWEYFSRNNSMVRLLISSPSLTIGYLLENKNNLLEATYITFFEAIMGLLIATVFSFGMMILCFYNSKLMSYILPVMITSQVIPLIVLAPFFIILFGIGLTSKIAMASVMSFFPIFVNFAQGYQAISRNIHELMLVYNAPLKYKVFNVYFPLSMPSIMAGLKVSATLSVIGAIVAEFNGAEVGLGKNLFLSAIRLEPDLMMTSLFLSTTIGMVLYYIVYKIEYIFLFWQK